MGEANTQQLSLQEGLAEMKKHVRYIGDKMMIYISVAMLIFILMPFGLIAYLCAIKEGEVILALSPFIFGSVVISIAYAAKFVFPKQFFAICVLDDRAVTVKRLFKRDCVIEYAKCNAVGIGSYIHAIAPTSVGTEQKFIYLSYERLTDRLVNNINQLNPDKSRVKIGFSEKTYRYLMEHLPPDQAAKLRQSDYPLYLEIMGEK